MPLAQAKIFDAALTKAGVLHQFLIIKNGEHSGSAIPGTPTVPSTTEIDKAIYDFLAKYLKGV